MFQILADSKFDFMKRGQTLLAVSTAVCVVLLGVLVFRGVDLGVEFAGGSELQLRFAEAPDVADVRSTLTAAGLPGVTVTTSGKPEEHELIVKIAASGSASESESDDEDNGARLTQAATDALRADSLVPGRADLNVLDASALERLLLEVGDLTSDRAAELAAAIVDRRDSVGIFHAVDELSSVPDVDGALVAALGERAYTGPLVLRRQMFIGPAIGHELIRSALGAVFGSLLGMLVYIWIRFQLQWGFAAVLALAHDVILTVGLFAVSGRDLTLAVVAAFLALVGYSVNDTVVVFDRIRENLRLGVGTSFEDTINRSINQTLSRTIITSGSTFVVVLGLLLFGGGGLRDFSFVMTIGVLVGTYSSIFIASPLLVRMRRMFGESKAEAAAGEAEAPRRARKVRTT